MPYELKIWNANKGVLLNTITDETTGGLSDGFKWQLTPTGDTVQLEASGRNDRLRLHPLAIVQLRVDDEPAFYGVVPDPDSLNSQEVTSFQVLGGREVLRRTLMDGTAFRDMGVYAIARSIFSRLCPPTLTYDPTQIGDGSGTDAGPVLSTYYAPTSTLDDVLTALARAAGAAGGVDNQGRIFLGRPTLPPLAVTYSSQPWRRLRVQGRETVTQAVLRVVSAPGGPTPDERRTRRVGGWVDYLPATITTTATHALHGTYRAQRAVEPPDGAPLVTSGARSLGGVYRFSSPDAAIDGDPSTYAESQARDDVHLPALYVVNRTAQRPVGVRVRYSVQDRQEADRVRLLIEHFGGDVFDRAVFDLPNDEYIREQTIIFPPSPQTAATYRQLTVQFRLDRDVYQPSDVFGAGVIRVYDVQPLVVNEDAAQRVAESYLQVAPTSPAEVSLPTLVPPRPEVTITGSPDGDVTGSTNLWEYIHQSGQLRSTLIRLGSDGQSDVGRAIRFATRGA